MDKELEKIKAQSCYVDITNAENVYTFNSIRLKILQIEQLNDSAWWINFESSYNIFQDRTEARYTVWDIKEVDKAILENGQSARDDALLKALQSRYGNDVTLDTSFGEIKQRDIAKQFGQRPPAWANNVLICHSGHVGLYFIY